MPAPFRSRLSRQLATVATLGVLAVSSSTAASVIVAGDTPRRVARLDPASPFNLDAFRTAHALRTSIDSLIAPLGAHAPIDTQVLEFVVSRVQHGEPSVWIGTDSSEKREDSIALRLYRQFARASTLPALWGYRDGPPVTATAHLPIRKVQPIRELHEANERAADSALAAGDIPLAMMRARENIAIARHYLGEPHAIDVLVGRNLLKRGVRLMQRVALVGDDPHTVTAAKDLERLVDRTFASAPLYSRLHRYARDPKSPQLVALAADRTVHPALRIASLGGIVLGACLNTREVLFGIDAARREAFEAAALAIADIPRSGDLMPRFRKHLALADSASLETLETFGIADGEVDTPKAFERFVSEQVRARVMYCRVQLGQ